MKTINQVVQRFWYVGLLALHSTILLGCATTNPSTSDQEIAMPSVQQDQYGEEFIQFSFLSLKRGMQTVRLDHSEPYGDHPGSRQWRGVVVGDPASTATLTQYKNRVFATIKSEVFGYYEIRGDAQGMLDILTLSDKSYLGNTRQKSQFGHD